MAKTANAAAAWHNWIASEAAEKHIRVVISRRFRNRPLARTDVDDLVGDIQRKLLEKAEQYNPARGKPSTLGSKMIPRMLSDVVDWLQANFPERYRAVALSRMVPRKPDDGNSDGPPEAEAVPDRYDHERAVQKERDAGIHAALATLDAPTQRFAKRIMDEDMSAAKAGAFLDWGPPEIADAIARIQVALARVQITEIDRP